MDDVISVRRSSWNEIWPQCEHLMYLHYCEVRQSSLLPFEVDHETVGELERLGLLVVAAAFKDEEELVGYSIWTISPSLESKGNLVAMQGPWFVYEPYRGAVGKRLWDCSIGQLKEKGIRVALPHHWMHGEGPRLGRFFERLGAKPLELSYELSLIERD